MKQRVARADAVDGGRLQLLIEAERRKDLAHPDTRAFESVVAEEFLDDVRIFDRVQVMAVRRILLAKRHQIAPEPDLEIRKARRRQICLLDRDPFLVGDAKEEVAAEVRIDDRLHGELHFANAEPRTVGLRRSLWREIADEIADGAEVGKEPRVSRSRRATGLRSGARLC